MTTTYDEAIAACQDCMVDCERCMAEMMNNPDGGDCPTCCRECVETCLACLLAMARESKYVGAYCKLCADVCDWCAAVCEQHDHEHCQRCAQSCRRCAEQCRAHEA